MPKRLNKSAELVWTRMVSISGILVDRIEANLKDEGLPPLSWYDVLLEVERAGPGGIRPFEIKERLLLPQYGTSRLLKRLADAGYVTTADCVADGRGQIVTITPAGRDIRAQMWPVYANALRTDVQEKLTGEEAEQLAALLGKLRPT
ncbi:MarR family transcriptional regulator [Hwanghaeella grinnelliae]|uniref:MarR family transcriptional regulator n=1 Tax=Hwanghaeella grinnelliae TaxID=2500179 RepID=A0A3S3UL82_9PROT|nr:MarR family winged helix-turn-helix transcriptional regulator [Hwanghaeella grinnelliae]RVU33883.1 MarR family transcriptional regulator [Hwanghaeella grinnelliae]